MFAANICSENFHCHWGNVCGVMFVALACKQCSAAACFSDDAKINMWHAVYGKKFPPYTIKVRSVCARAHLSNATVYICVCVYSIWICVLYIYMWWWLSTKHILCARCEKTLVWMKGKYYGCRHRRRRVYIFVHIYVYGIDRMFNPRTVCV